MSLKASIEIAAPPSAVRAKFLDFTSLPSYTRAFESITSPKPGTELVKGDKVSVKLANSPAFSGVIETNTPTHFSWTGSLPFIFTGTHSFYFSPSDTTPNGTTFTQEEFFSGVLGYALMGDNVVGRAVGMKEKTQKGWIRFNEDLKRVLEGEVGGKQ
ncbi:hypothetical protein BU25DRAFT_368125 [Macroventuria anomochaeta]|uniref:Uncharacterized protein n=1 Tax=Macroventuria anomochaeta TaxID=301207 RepID=A0ACB6RZY5_9PLEO|nr:uncharacterized protein BU25DRAFT_368125 [Macroventuria anomochaeta]KAF2627272.1 hypothetical protein BU25DRAFT_368125 [Macroventuria anomochaeta]